MQLDFPTPTNRNRVLPSKNRPVRRATSRCLMVDSTLRPTSLPSQIGSKPKTWWALAMTHSMMLRFDKTSDPWIRASIRGSWMTVVACPSCRIHRLVYHNGTLTLLVHSTVRSPAATLRHLVIQAATFSLPSRSLTTINRWMVKVPDPVGWPSSLFLRPSVSCLTHNARSVARAKNRLSNSSTTTTTKGSSQWGTTSSHTSTRRWTSTTSRPTTSTKSVWTSTCPLPSRASVGAPVRKSKRTPTALEPTRWPTQVTCPWCSSWTTWYNNRNAKTRATRRRA